jgi:calcium-dependent protein kinase
LEQLKIIDFGTAIQFKTGEPITERVGTPYYIAPEVLNRSYNEKADLWSVGVTLYVLVSGIPPYTGETDQEIMKKIRSGAKLQFPMLEFAQISQDCKDLIT